MLLEDSFTPVIRRFVERRGVVYTAALERAVLSQPQVEAAGVLVGLGVAGSPKEVVAAYFEERAAYVKEQPVRVVPGALALLERLRATGVQLVCYGGLEYRHFEEHLGSWASYFDGPRYVCTDGFRPGVREIAEDVFGLAAERVLFIDDVARVAERARELGAAFVGHPGRGFQREFMRDAGVRHVVDSLGAIDDRLLRTVDAEAASGTLWPSAPTASGPASGTGRADGSA
ncbi:HAD family hydrolase [Streptomyces fructofermentans]|uniref:HAD family hydrolase n=1 Tax=Streptomyces fructofermentans TaxID=152141 RepID=UPI0027E3B658|nr:HAD family phosphatase [Streptomyces fructofermentans]